MTKFIDLTGRRFERLIVVKRLEDRVQASGGHVVTWHCRCDCGKEIVASSRALRIGRVKSCGCYRRDKFRSIRTTHDGSKSRLYGVWRNMRERCNNPNRDRYKDWGGRGIKICDEWSDFQVFYEWGMANGYDETAPRGKFTLDRIDNDGDYKPDNCRWANMVEQNRNKRLDRRNESGCSGVYWDKRNKKWVARISIGLGDFENVDDAIAARKTAEKKYFNPMSN